jgi:hypothetical protein
MEDNSIKVHIDRPIINLHFCVHPSDGMTEKKFKKALNNVTDEVLNELEQVVLPEILKSIDPELVDKLKKSYQRPDDSPENETN